MVRSLEGKHPLYFEAILQLRDVSDDVVAYARLCYAENPRLLRARVPERDVLRECALRAYAADE